MKLRHFNPIRHMRLEREVAAIPGHRRAIKSLVDSIGRQAPPGELAALKCQVMALELRLSTIAVAVSLSLLELSRGRAGFAKEILEAVSNETAVEHQQAS